MSVSAIKRGSGEAVISALYEAELARVIKAIDKHCNALSRALPSRYFTTTRNNQKRAASVIRRTRRKLKEIIILQLESGQRKHIAKTRANRKR